VLKGVDGVVFVADSQRVAQEANEESLQNLKGNLQELGLRMEEVPLVFQYNKRDLTHIVPLAEMREALNDRGAPDFEAAAFHGVGVFETLKAVSRVALGAIRTKVAEDPRPAPGTRTSPIFRPQAPAPPPPAPPPPRPAAGATRAPSRNALHDLVPDPKDVAEVKVEFAEEVTGKNEMRAVSTLGSLDIEQELAKLRTEATRAKEKGPGREMDRLVAGLLDAGKGTRQEVKRKATVEVPEKALQGATGFRLNIVFEKDGKDEPVESVLLVKLVGNTRKLDRLNLKLDLDLKSRS